MTADAAFARALNGRGFAPGGAGGPKAAPKPAPRAIRDGEIDLGRTANGDAVGLHLGKLIEGRLLIQGNSGAGKSMLLRRKFATQHGYHRGAEGWTPDEVEQLKAMYAERRPVKDIAEALGKPASGIAAKASRLGLKQCQERGDSLVRAAELIGRPYPNVAAVASRMGLSFKAKRGAAGGAP